MGLLNARVVKVSLLLAVVAIMAASCGGGSGGEKTVHGLVTDVQARSITEVATLTLEEEDTGKVWTFQAEGHIGLTPSHLREHMLQGLGVTVRYQERQGQLIAVLVTD